MDMSALFNTKFRRVHDLEECLESIRTLNENQAKRIKYLEEENERLKSEHYKDETIKELNKKLKTMEENYYRGFPISKKEMEIIEEWKEKHDKEKHNLHTAEQRVRAGGVSGGRHSYRFVPTGIGTIGEVICSCGDSFCFRELG